MTFGQMVLAVFVVLGVAFVAAGLGCLMAMLFERYPEVEDEIDRRVWRIR